MEDFELANLCLNILCNDKRLPNYAYYEPDDDVHTMFFNELTKKEIQKIKKYIYFHNKK